MVRIREPVTGWGPLHMPSASLHSDPAGLSQQPEPQPGQVRQEAAGPVVVLSLSFSGSCRPQGEVERVPELVCTAGPGVLGERFTPYLRAHPANATAAIAECWADSAGQLLYFHEQLGHPRVSAASETSRELTGPAAGRTGSGPHSRLVQNEG